MKVPHTYLSTGLKRSRRALRSRLRDLFAASRPWGRAPLACALALILFAGPLASCAPSGSSVPATEGAPSEAALPPAEEGEALLAVRRSLDDLEPYVPSSSWTPDVVSAGTMGEVLVDTELLNGVSVVCYREPGSEYTKYWAIRREDGSLLRFAAEDSAYAGGYSVEDFSDLPGRRGFAIRAPRGAAYDALDYYVFDGDGVPRLRADAAQPAFQPDLDGDGRADLIWFYHGGREGYCYLRWEGDLYQVDLTALVREAFPGWTGGPGPVFSSGGFFYGEEGTELAFLAEEDGALRFGLLCFRPGAVEVWAAPEGTEVDWQAENSGGRAGFLTFAGQTWAVLEEEEVPCLAAVLSGLSQEPAWTPFTDILGTDGYALDYRQPGSICRQYYDTSGAPLALSFGWDREEWPVDLDGDGVRELVCNVTSMADGVPSVLVYRRVGGEVWEAYPSGVPAEMQGRPRNGMDWTRYDPDTNTVTTSCQFLGEDERQEWTAALALDSLEFYPCA